MNAIRWSEHRLYAALVSRVPDELHATLARAADLTSAYAWLRDGTRPAGLDDEGKSLDGLEGPGVHPRRRPALHAAVGAR